MVIGIDASRANVRERTGTEWYAFQIIRSMVRLAPQTQFILYLKHAPLPDLENLGSNVSCRIIHWPFRYLWNLGALSLEMILRKPDVLFVPAHTMPIVHPQRTVITLHDIGFERFPELYSTSYIAGDRTLTGRFFNLLARTITRGAFGSSAYDYHRWASRYACVRAAHIITVSEFSKTEIATFYHVAPERISVIPHGIDRSVFTRPSDQTISETKARFHLNHPYLLFAGRLERKKNIQNLVEIYERVQKTLPKLDLVLVGSPGLGWGETKQYLDHHHLTSSVHLLGWQPQQIYVPVLAGAEAFLFLSRYEGFGMPVLEAMSIGTPVVISPIPALREVSANAALVINPDNVPEAAGELLKLLDKTTLRTELITQGHARAQAFAWEKAAAQTLEILITVASSTSPLRV